MIAFNGLIHPQFGRKFHDFLIRNPLIFCECCCKLHEGYGENDLEILLEIFVPHSSYSNYAVHFEKLRHFTYVYDFLLSLFAHKLHNKQALSKQMNEQSPFVAHNVPTIFHTYMIPYRYGCYFVKNIIVRLSRFLLLSRLLSLWIKTHYNLFAYTSNAPA